LREGKKIAIVKMGNDRKLTAGCLDVNNKNIYYQSKKQAKDLETRDKIEKAFETHPAYGHRRLAMDLKMNKKKVLRIMHK